MIQLRAAIAFLAGMQLSCMLSAWPALAVDCPGNPDALGTSRTITVDPAALARVGAMNYQQTMPLEPKEVILTFDDGPWPPTTMRALEILKSQCVKATFFLIGRSAQAFASTAQQIARDGHTVASHSQNHPYFNRVAYARGVREIDDSFRSIAAALEPAGFKPAPFFRFPGLLSTQAYENYLQSHGITSVSTDVLASDWFRRLQKHPEGILERAITRLEARGSGILLLHDIKPATVLMLPDLLKELKERGYKIVHMVPAENAAPLIAAAPESSAPETKASTADTDKPKSGRRRIAALNAESHKSKTGKRRIVASAEARQARHKPPENASSFSATKPAEKYWPRVIEKDSHAM
ncbi:MAG: polysaccharide deacetylase family protein [Xanthobacteraceae bacterium]|nr:polysaccharide deacetylase family protein [Xanthobacteraceae bacterium]